MPKLLELSKVNHAIEVGDIENLGKVISTVIEALIAGELNKRLTESASNLA